MRCFEEGWRKMEIYIFVEEVESCLKEGMPHLEAGSEQRAETDYRREREKEGSRKEGQAISTRKQDVPGSRGGSFFPLYSCISHPPNCCWFPGFLYFPTDCFSPKRQPRDCLSDKLHDGCTG